MAVTSVSVSLRPLLSVSKQKFVHFSCQVNKPTAFLALSSSLSTPFLPIGTIGFCRDRERRVRIWRISATPEEALSSDATAPLQNAEQMVNSSDDGSGTVISVLLFIGFIALSMLTIGVIYLAVTDFLQKRETEKFEKEETSNKKKGNKKVKARSKSGPRGFGQKTDDIDDD